MPASKYNTTKDLIAEIFRRLDAAKITTGKIARSLGVPAPRVSEWRKGKHAPSQENLDALAGLLGLTVNQTLTRLNKPKDTR